MAAYEAVETEEVEGTFLPGKPDLDAIPDDEDDQMVFTQHIRMMAINQMSTGGQLPVHDKDQMGVLVKLLDGVDKQVIGKKRLRQGEQGNANVAAVAKLLEQFSLDVAKSGTETVIGATLVDQPARDPSLFNKDLSGQFNDIDQEEMAQESRSENSEEFFRRIEEENEELRK